LAAFLQAFKQLDKDGSGTICIEELTEACRWALSTALAAAN
jgi:Ca2+-binding EF-hand superfamily protein